MRVHPERPARRTPRSLRALAAACYLAAVSAGAAAEEHHAVFVIDQSGSMWRSHGPEDAWPPNDPLGNRYEPVLQAYEELQSRVSSEQDTESVFILHVVEFAGGVRRHSPAATVRFDPAAPLTQQGVAATKSRLSGLMSPTGLDHGETDVLAALTEAADIVDGLAGVAPERILVLLVTDGKPYVGGRDASGPQYRAELEAVARRLTSKGVLFDVVGISSPNAAYWPTWGPFWEQVSSPHTAYSVENATEVSPLVDEVLRKWLGLPQAMDAPSPYYCPPYLRSITFTVYKKQRGGQVEIRDSHNRLLEGGLPGVTVTDEQTYARYVMFDPPPGLWTIDGTAVEVKVEPFYRRIRRQTPETAANVGFPETFRYEVLSAEGNPFRELPQYPISVVLEIEDPGGAVTTLPLVQGDEGPFESTTPHAFDDEGVAKLRFRATTRLLDSDRTEVEVFSNADLLPISRKELLILDAGETLPAVATMRFGRLELRPELTIRRFDAPDSVAPSAVSSNPGRLVDFRMVHRDGTEIADGPGWLDMAVSETGGLAVVGAVRRPLLSWDFLRRRPLALFAQVRIDDAALDDGLLVRELRRDEPIDSDLRAAFDRAGALPALVDDPLAVTVVGRESLWSYLLLLALAAGGAALFMILLGRLGVLLAYSLSDALRKQTVIVVIEPVGGEEYGGTKKVLTGRRRKSFKKQAVGIRIGDDPDHPDWQPAWLEIRRLFRPWTGQLVVKVSYPVEEGVRTRRRSTILRERDRPVRLDGMHKAEASIEVRRRGKLTTEKELLWGQ